MKDTLYADDLVLMNKTVEGLKKGFCKIKKCIGEQGTESES